MSKQSSRFLFIIYVLLLFFGSIWSLVFSTSHSVVISDVTLFSINSVSISMSWVLDPISLSFSAVVVLVASSVFMFSSSYMSDDAYSYRFTGLLFLFVLSMLVLIYSQSYLTLLMGWDGLGVTSFLLIIYYSNKSSLESGFLTLMINRLGDVLIMISIISIIPMGYSLIFYPLSDMALSTLFLLITLAGLTKSAQYPFSSWLPAAMAAPTPVSALVHSSTLVTAGIYLILRYLMVPSMNFEFFSSILLFTGSTTCLLGGAAAMVENDIKKLIALSTLSQLGVMVVSLSLGAFELTLYHLYSHAMFKALLFIAAGYILMMSYGTQDLRLLGGILKYNPALAFYFILPSLCLMGMPFVTGFYSKHTLLEIMMTSSVNSISLIFLFISVVFSSGYVIRLLSIMIKAEVLPLLTSNNMPLYNYFPMVVLSLMSIMFGFFYSVNEFGYVHNSSISYAMGMWLMVLLPMGVVVGLLNFKLPHSLSWLLSTMLFLSPLSKNLVYLHTPISKAISTLDLGWLEPYNSIEQVKSLHKWVMGTFMWPRGSFGFQQSLTVFIVISLWVLLLY
uniref:NADH-ubiquinone oxidoreductase chain 5 n=1 Tax=Cerion incanum TaxID=145432 RepID=A0A0A0QYM8_9EUPU|nr:NADH dehydrogenase subunit 5 [Cerion incanum]AIU94457.1 NADH dehydrogenase subunit 5 [Cerion incanum]